MYTRVTAYIDINFIQVEEMSNKERTFFKQEALEMLAKEMQQDIISSFVNFYFSVLQPPCFLNIKPFTQFSFIHSTSFFLRELLTSQNVVDLFHSPFLAFFFSSLSPISSLQRFAFIYFLNVITRIQKISSKGKRNNEIFNTIFI